MPSAVVLPNKCGWVPGGVYNAFTSGVTEALVATAPVGHDVVTLLRVTLVGIENNGTAGSVRRTCGIQALAMVHRETDGGQPHAEVEVLFNKGDGLVASLVFASGHPSQHVDISVSTETAERDVDWTLYLERYTVETEPAP